MILPIDQMQALAAECAPSVAAETLLSVVKVESGFDPLAIGVNGAPAIRVRANSREEAAGKAAALIADGRSVDLGLGQINSRNLDWLGITIAEAFDPCRNLAASARVLQDGYARGARRDDGEQPALLAALSYYNTGHPDRGLRNGYVAKVTKAAAAIVPALKPAANTAPPASLPGAETPQHPAWAVFGGEGADEGFVIRISTPSAKGGQQ
jgi:type IV secretion system protein VirB1